MDHSEGRLLFRVSDDGAGLDGSPAGHGFVDLRDRLGAVEGELVVHSVPGTGTTVTGTIPVAAT